MHLIIRTINRREGFKYRIDDIDILLKNFDNITLVIKKVLKKRKINFFSLNNNNLDDKSLIELEKKI